MQNVCKRSKSAIFRAEGDSPMIPGGQDPLQQNFAETLPTEMSVRIFSELDIRSLCRASLTCRQWNDIIEGSDHLWRSHCLTVLAVCRREVNGDRLNGCSWKVCVICCILYLSLLFVYVYSFFCPRLLLCITTGKDV